MFISPVPPSPTFGVKGTPRDDLMKRHALRDISFCLSESRVYSQSLYTRINWLELAGEAEQAARRFFASDLEIAHAKARVL